MTQLTTITADNIDNAVGITLRPGQEQFVAPVVQSLAEAYVHPAAWPRLVTDGDDVVGFVMGSFDPDNEIDFFRCGIWRLNISGEHQGRGYGRFAVQGVIDEARRRGEQRVTVLWIPREDGPEDYYLNLGFTPTGPEFYGQTVGELFID
ncbi:MAG: GNAT family N-acetyltransferase [Actinobacteria bacterium]|nr:GNAT family N-acetyltransferase [Actinomycetota bacterium]